MSDHAQSVDAEAKPATSFKAGNYQVTGKIVSFKKGELKVRTNIYRGSKAVATSLTVRVSPNATIDLRVADYALAKKGDSIEVSGFTYTRKKGQEAVAGVILAESVKIKGSRPLAAPKLAAKAAAKPKPKAVAKSDEEDADAPPTAKGAVASKRDVDSEMSEDAPEPEDPAKTPAKLIFIDKFAVDKIDQLAKEEAGASQPAGEATKADEPREEPDPTEGKSAKK
jgi:hypothetical protein